MHVHNIWSHAKSLPKIFDDFARLRTCHVYTHHVHEEAQII